MKNARIHERNGHAAGNDLNGANGAHGANGTAGTPAANGTVPSATADNGAPPAEGRDAGGRFAAGNKAGRGNPFYRRLCQMRQAVLEEIGEEGLRRLARALYERALRGDVAAARTLLAYLVGKPQAAADPDRADLDEFQLVADRPSQAAVLLALIDSVPAGPAAEGLQRLHPAEQDPDEVLKQLAGVGGRRKTAAHEVAEEQAAKRRRTK
ncbi:MAG TPA: hypothetical protein VEL76_41765 [Gemmataceae bacterium]|nr:hypothetical protein [Gemmataceae bacterium]